MKFIDGLTTKWSGAIPATMIYDSKGELREFWEGSASYETLEKNVLEVLKHEEPRKEAS